MAITKAERALRREIIDQCRWMNANGINQGTSGNLSARYKDVMLITPSGLPYDEMTVADIAALPIDGADGAWSGPLAPSSEWRFHRDILRSRAEVNAVVHSHATYATALAIAHKPIPACHYMIAAVGGNTVRCAQYATFGSAALSANVLSALQDRAGCLIENHGLIATGDSLKKAMWLAVEIETLAKQYYLTLAIGGPVLLADAEIDRVKAKFKSYGMRPIKPRSGAAKRRKRP